MVKRLLSANTSDLLEMTASELKQSIKASEGRTIVSENVAGRESLVGDITNAEVARAFGADLILLNGVDVLNPVIAGIEPDENNSASSIETLRRFVGRPVGVNLEPVDQEARMAEDKLTIALGRQANEETLQTSEKLGFDFICLTGNPGTGVTNKQINEAIKRAKEHFSGLVIAGKMHGAGVDEPVADIQAIQSFVESGADIILVPAVGTVPGFDASELKEVVKIVHQAGALVMSAIGTSQESSDEETIRQIAIQNKVCGVDIQHIGDAGYSGLAPVENIFALSKAIRGGRHTISMVARSIHR
ncbi:haloacid dehalogenase-like hydrolase [Enterococcus sp. BWM-S5]|uniref:Haloacid dehalogenase-like hydrolase n=1 Tax=Enterococcus larvae TaxID=2794352 RepID=A0ABS4CHZ8_9ENTE|nr:haloacid dehalogenase-like hydrolase [Enterococcus larvae]MBP1046202.1 haloacid dehalogenase-like hydrolase [Enterococcus larvae]